MHPQTDWERARGCYTLDCNCYNVLVRASVGEVAEALAEVAETWDKDVLGRPILIDDESLFVFRLKGHDRSVVVWSDSARSLFGKLGEEGEKWLSRRLHADLIVFGRSDTCGTIGYTLIEDGEQVERFYWGEGEGEEAAGDDSIDPQPFQFASTRRGLDSREIGDPCRFVEEFLSEEGAFDPGIEFSYFLGTDTEGVGTTVINPGFEIVTLRGRFRDTPPIERVDHLVLRSS